MKSNNFLQVIIALLISFIPHTVLSQQISGDEAVNWAEDKGRLLLETFQEKNIKERYAKLDNLFDKYVDVNYVAKFVVGRYWRDMSAEQKDEYVKVFGRYVKAIYKTFPLDFVSRLSYQVLGAEQGQGFTNVNAQIKIAADKDIPAQEFLLSFRLHRDNGEIRLVDIKFAESSLLLSYRGKFYEMIAVDDGDLEWFIEDLADITTEAEQSNNRKLSLQ